MGKNHIWSDVIKSALLHFLEMKNKKILILGFGNPDREDDGVAWHVLSGVATELGLDVPASPDEEFFSKPGMPDLIFMLQLVPEISELLSKYDSVCFVDAHTGAIDKNINIIEIGPEYRSSPFTHHLTPQSCLELTRTVYGKSPLGILVSIRGYQFGFNSILSAETSRHSRTAVKVIISWLKTGKINTSL